MEERKKKAMADPREKVSLRMDSKYLSRWTAIQLSFKVDFGRLRKVFQWVLHGEKACAP